MLSKGNKRDKTKCCRFHKDYGHDTDERRHLKEEIELLIKRGHLKKFVRDDNGVINTIIGGPTAGGTSSTARKAYARQVNAIHTCNKKMKVENEISFSDVDLNNLILPHDDALVITILVANWDLKKILVDNGSSADILYYLAFKQMLIGDDRLKPVNSNLFGFSREIVKVEG
ncbi:uncharacterized protein LOC143856032 [Tasmannia lanceolata]|uniref:uncharacterized protein LOC143856032 n=1 Tax=Tasmannia lanceolata TaxID=3420 RepID=UPI0040630962